MNQKLNSVKVLFADSKYNYDTNVSAKSTEQTATKYFVGQDFDLGIYPHENMQTCIGIEFTDNNIEPVVKHHSGMVYNKDKKYYVCGARNAWDTVKIGLFETEQDAKGCFPQDTHCVREASQLDINQFFGLK